MAEEMNATKRIKEEELINEGFRKRTNHENADVYKIFSILYGLVVFIGGVTFSISHAIIPEKEAETIKHLAEIYFTYLYWVSIIWIMFCIIDIIHHRRKVEIPTSPLNRLTSNQISLIGNTRLPPNKLLSITSETNRESLITPVTNVQLFDSCEEEEEEEQLDDKRLETIANDESIQNDNISHRSLTMDTTRDVLTRRHALDSTEKHDLRTYMRHRRDSIVQHVIGYNYDDNSIVGGLYTRVGIGIFCLGTVIHAGLSILSNLENVSCARWTAVMDDVSRLLFTFIQFFFVFKHSNLIIRTHESLARLSVIHIVVTNLCVWFRMVVIETKSQIMEVDGHEMIIAEHKNTISHFNNGGEKHFNLLDRLLTLPSECLNVLSNDQLAKGFIHEGYIRLKPLLYPCTIEFSLMCLTLFFLIWENIGKTFTHKISNKASTKNVFMVNCHGSIKGLFGGMIVFSCSIISIILYVVFRNKMTETIHLTSTLSTEINHDHRDINFTNSTRMSLIIPGTIIATHPPFTTISNALTRIDYSIVILEIANLCLLALSLCATMGSLIKIRKLNYRRTTTRFDDVLIIISLAGIYLYSIFSAFAIIANLSSSTWFAYVKLAILILEFVEGTVQALFILIALRKHLRQTNKHDYSAREMITLLITVDLSLWFEKTTTTTKHQANPFQLAFYHVIPWSIIAAIATPLQIFFRFHASVCLSHVWANMYQLPNYDTIFIRDI